MDKMTVTVDKHYAFTIKSDRVEEFEDNYDVTIVTAPDGNFHVTGKITNVESFADDICIGDSESVDAIMDTAR